VDSSAANDCNRRVLKAQSVDAINRKNVLFSARCRSGRDLKVGSPLIRRKFSDDEESPEAGNGEVSPPSALDAARSATGRTIRRDPREEIRELERMVSSLDADLDRESSLSPSASDEALPPSPSPGRVHFRPATLRDLPSNDVKVAFLSGVDLFLEPDANPSASPRGSARSSPSGSVSAASTPISTPTPTPVSSPDSSAPAIGRQMKHRTASDPQILDSVLPANNAHSRPSLPSLGSSKTATAVSVNDIRKAFEKTEISNGKCGSVGAFSSGGVAPSSNGTSAHVRMSSMDSTTSEDGSLGPLQREHYGSISSLASTTSLISQQVRWLLSTGETGTNRPHLSSLSPCIYLRLDGLQELQQLIDDANQTLEESNANSSATSHELLVVILHRDSAGGSVGITLAGGADYEAKEITVSRRHQFRIVFFSH